MSAAGRPDLKRASSADASLSLSSDARPRTAKRIKTEKNDDSSSTATDTVHVRRIEIPKHVAFLYINGKLIGTKGTTCKKQLESKLGIKYDVIHRQLKASQRHLGQTRRYGDIAPIWGSPNCIMIRAKTREIAQHAVKVIVHILSNEFRGKTGTSGETLRKELLESVQEATLHDPSFYKLTFSSSTDSGNVPKSAPSNSIAYNRIGPVKSWRGQNDVEVRRIVCPSYLSVGKLRGALIGPAGANKDELVRKMSAQLWFYSPRDEWDKKYHVLFGNMLPALDHPCIMLRAGNEDTANDAVEIIIDELCGLFPSAAQLRQDLITSVAGTTVEDEGFIEPSMSENDDDSLSNDDVIDPNYIFSMDSFTASDDEEETWGRRKKRYQTNRHRNIHRKHSHFERRGSRSARASGSPTSRRSRSSYEPTWSRSPVKRSRPNIVTPAKRPAPTIDSALSSKR